MPNTALILVILSLSAEHATCRRLPCVPVDTPMNEDQKGGMRKEV